MGSTFLLTAGLVGIGVVVDGSYSERPVLGAYVVNVPIFTQEFVSNFLAMRAGAYYSLPWFGPTRDTVIAGDTATVVANKSWGFEVSAGYRRSWLYLGPIVGFGYRWDAVHHSYLNDTSFVFYGGVILFKLRSLFLEGGYHTGRGVFGGLGTRVYFPGDYD